MSGHSVAVEIPVARLHRLAARNRGRAIVPASVAKGSRMNAGGPFINNPLAGLARLIGRAAK